MSDEQACPVPDPQLDAHGRLMDRVTASEDVPCVEHPDPAWTTEDADDARYIARLCARCPILTACRSYGIEHHEPVGVWGGLTLADRRRRRRERAA